jgi:hypothetical protein
VTRHRTGRLNRQWVADTAGYLGDLRLVGRAGDRRRIDTDIGLSLQLAVDIPRRANAIIFIRSSCGSSVNSRSA